MISRYVDRDDCVNCVYVGDLEERLFIKVVVNVFIVLLRLFVIDEIRFCFLVIFCLVGLWF